MMRRVIDVYIYYEGYDRYYEGYDRYDYLTCWVMKSHFTLIRVIRVIRLPSPSLEALAGGIVGAGDRG